MYIKGTKHIVSKFYRIKKGYIIFLPNFKFLTGSAEEQSEFVISCETLKKGLNDIRTEHEILIPDWVDKYSIINEKEERTKLIQLNIEFDELKKMSDSLFDNMVKAVVDIEKDLIAVDAELHSDLEALLLENGSKQNNLWGINLYPESIKNDNFVEFDSMINMRPSQGNKSRNVENTEIRSKIIEIVKSKIKK